MWTETSACPYNLDNFEWASFDSTLDFIYDLETSDLLNDKAVIPRLEEWVYEYDLTAYQANHHSQPPRPVRGTKRAILNFLKHDSLDIRSAVEAVDQRRVPQREKVMVAVPKEREFKREDARFDCKLTDTMGLWQRATEKSIADRFMPYVPHQTMTMDEEESTYHINKLNAPRGN